MTLYCMGCGRETYPQRATVPFDYPESDYGCGRLKVVHQSGCCGEPITQEQPHLWCPVEGCSLEMDRVDDDCCECEKHGQREIKEILYLNNDQGLRPYPRNRR